MHSQSLCGVRQMRALDGAGSPLSDRLLQIQTGLKPASLVPRILFASLK